MAPHTTLLVFALALAVAESARLPANASFEQYAATFRRDLSKGSPEYQLRRSLFEKRAETVRAHNQQPGQRWRAGLNRLTDHTDGELKRLLGWRHPGRAGHATTSSSSAPFAALLAEGARLQGPPPKEVDWRHLKSTQHIEDQGSCGSCWALAAAEMMQAHYEIQTKKMRSFSAQELVSCVPNPRSCGGDGGCEGATVELAMEYIQKHGLRSNSEVPYEAETGSCPHAPSLAERGSTSNAVQGLVGWSKLPENRARPVMLALMNGPVAVSVGATDWMPYEGGVYDGCGKDSVVNHAVLLVGYGEEDAEKYWTIQNSWGPDWGEDGFIRLVRRNAAEEDEQYCGTDDSPKDGTACKPYPTSVKVCGMCGMLYDSVAPLFDKPVSGGVDLKQALRASANKPSLRQASLRPWM